MTEISPAIQKIIDSHRSPARQDVLTMHVEEMALRNPHFLDLYNVLVEDSRVAGFRETEVQDLLAMVNTQMVADDPQFGQIYKMEGTPEQNREKQERRFNHIPSDLRQEAMGILLYEQLVEHFVAAAHGALPALDEIPNGGLTDERKLKLEREFGGQYMKAQFYPEHERTTYLSQQDEAPLVAASEWFRSICRRELTSTKMQAELAADAVTMFTDARKGFLDYAQEVKAARSQGYGGVA